MGVLLYLAGLLDGGATNVAVGMNTTLGKTFAEHGMPSALAIQGIGLLALLLIALLSGVFSSHPSYEALARMPWWGWAGGAVQALTVFAVLVAAGAALFSALTVTGGTIKAAALDHYGLLGSAQRDTTLLRLGGCALPVAGTVLVARG